MNIIREESLEFDVQATEKTEQDVMHTVFNRIKKLSYEQCKGYLVEMHVESLEVLEKHQHTETKKFLYFFMEKQVTRISIVCKATVKVKYIEKGILSK